MKVTKKLIVIIAVLAGCIFSLGSLVSAQEKAEPTVEENKIAPEIDEEDKVDQTTDQAEEGYEWVRGRLAGIDRKANQVIIRIDGTGQERLIVSKKELPANLKIGLHTKAKVKKGTNEAEYVKKIHHAGE